MKIFALSFPIFVLSAVSEASASAKAYRTYVNERYGYEISYPEFFVAGGVSGSGDGQVFRSPNGDAELRVFAHTCSGEQKSPSIYLKSYKRKDERGELILTSAYKDENSAVVTGSIGNKILYRKLLNENGWCTEFSFEYVETAKTTYDKAASKIATSFKP